jgi:hypothetical protein
MKKQTLQEQTSDPRWQKKRLQILERDKWTCKQCGDTETTLTVHHKSYRQENGKFVDYWDYENEDLVTLCNPCHEAEEKALLDIQKYCYFKLRSFFESAFDINMFLHRMEKFNTKVGRLETGDFYIVTSSVGSVDAKTAFMEELSSIIEVNP